MGLVEWTGTMGGVAGIDIVGAGFFRYNLVSECKCNRRVRIKGYVSTLAVGFGMTFTGSGSTASFYDYRQCPDPDVANGGAAVASASSVLGGGPSCSKTTLGNLFSKASCGGPSYGLDISAGLYFGASFVTESVVEKCDCESK